jgi:hypothetical protein
MLPAQKCICRSQLPFRDLWDLLCKVSDRQSKKSFAQKDAKITELVRETNCNEGCVFSFDTTDFVINASAQDALKAFPGVLRTPPHPATSSPRQNSLPA